MALVQQFESLLLSSYSQGVKDFSILQEELASDKPVASAAEALYMCKLPRTQQFRMISEKKKLLTVVTSNLDAVMEAEGYGREKKNAGEGKGKLS